MKTYTEMQNKLTCKSAVAAMAIAAASFFAPSMANGGIGRPDSNPPKGQSDTSAVASRRADTLQRNDRRRYDVFFIEAVRQQNAGHYAAAFDLFKRCIEIDPGAAEAYYALAAYYSEMQKDSLALLTLEKAAAIDPENDTYQERVAQYYIGTENYDKAIAAYENLYSHHRDRSDVLSTLGYLYRQKKDYRNLLRSIERIEEVDGVSDATALSKMNAYEMMGDKKRARATLQSLVDKNPNEPVYKVMLGNWLMQNDRKDEAFGLFTKALDEDPLNGQALTSMYDYYRSVGNDSSANKLRDIILLNVKSDPKMRMSMMQQAIKENEEAGGDSIKMLGLFDKVLAANPKDADMSALKAAYMQMKHFPTDSVCAALRHTLAIAPDNAPSRLQLIQLVWPTQKWDEIIDLCKPAVQYNPDEMAFYYFMGLAYFQKDDDDNALDAFRRGVGEINSQSDPDIVSDFYALMGDILYKKQQPEQAFAAYDSCLQWKSDNIPCLNNYAYYLSELRRDLQRAEQMSYKTVLAEPANSTYLDTYAWILFLERRYGEARTYIDKAVANDSADSAGPVVYEHAGDIYSLCGDQQKAVGFWQKALMKGGDKAILMKKIKKRKYVEK